MLALATAAVFWTRPLVGTLRHARALGDAAPLAFILVHVIGVVAFVPATVFAVAGGALFGFTAGLAYSMVGGVVGALAAFLLGRYVVRRFLAPRLARSAQLSAVDRAVAADGTRILLLLRLSPVMPFNVMNYALGASSLRTRDFLISSLGMIPGTAVAAYAGHVAGAALALAGQAQPVWNTSYYLALIAGLVATVVATAFVGRAARQALRNMA